MHWQKRFVRLRKAGKRKHKKRTARFYAVLVYLTSISLSFGMLRSAQKTRQAIYGGQPVMAQVTPTEQPYCYQVSLGGGEWVWTLTMPTQSPLLKWSEYLPPCMGKWVMQLMALTEKCFR